MTEVDTSMPGGTCEVLFIRFSSLGDVLLTTPAVAAVKESLPGSRITFLTKEAFAPLFAGNPSVDRVVRLEKGGEGLSGLIQTCRGLGKFDVVVDLHGNLRSMAARAALAGKRVLGYRTRSLERRLWTLGLARGGMNAREEHVIERYLHALGPLGVRAGPSAPVIYVTDEERARISANLAAQGLPAASAYVVLVPGARWPNKRCTVEGFTEVGRWVRRERGAAVVLAGDERDSATSAAVCGGVGEGCIDMSGRTSLRELAALLQGATVVVGNDSGPGHVAAAVGTPVVSLFGPTCEAFGFRPFGEKCRVVSHDVSCRPCSLHGGTGCPRGRRVCLEDIEAEEVVRVVRDLLPGNGS